MRPVNLIPPDERRVGRRTNRTGPASYLLIGSMLAVLGGVTTVVMTNNSIAKSEAEIAQLEQQEQAAQAQADSLRAFADFAAAEEARTATISTLAQSRFDWERVLRELALVIPAGVTLQNLSGTATPGVTLESSGGSGLSDEISGPSLSMSGCASGQPGVAAFVAALEDIDGVTRVGLSSSVTEEAGLDAAATSTGGACTGGATFELVAAFDDVAVSSAAPPAPAPPVAPTTDDGGVADATQQQEAGAQTVEQSSQEAQAAADFAEGQ